MERYKYYLLVDGSRVELHPSNVEGLQTVFTLENELKFSHEVNIEGDITLTGVDFKLFYGIETSNSRCDDSKIYIEKLCSGTYVPFIDGSLRTIDGHYDIDKCNITIKINCYNPYSCLDDNSKGDINIFESCPLQNRTSVKVVRGIIETKKVGPVYNTNDPYNEGMAVVPNIGSPYYPFSRDPREDMWYIYRNEWWTRAYNPLLPTKGERYYYYAREVLTLDCSAPSPGVEWRVIEDNCPTNRKWARMPIRVNYREVPTVYPSGILTVSDLTARNNIPSNQRSTGLIVFVQSENKYYILRGGVSNSDWSEFESTPSDILPDTSIIDNGVERPYYNAYAFDIMGFDGRPDLFDNGISLMMCLEYFIDKFCGIKIRSNFFQHNHTKSFIQAYPQLPDDGVTTNLDIFQKSDIKRLNASNNATKGITTFEKLLSSVCVLFNLQYRISDGFFNLEHVSYWEKVVGIDLTQSKYVKNLNWTNKYKYDSSKLPQYEEFKTMEALSPDFVGEKIQYFGSCITSDASQKTKTREAPIITTDVEYCIENPDSKSDKVSDLGFVIVASKIESGVKYIMTRPGVIEGYVRINNPLSWASLHESYYLHSRPQKQGLMNGRYQEFFSIIPTKKQDTISIPFCCGDELSLTDLVKTNIGEGVIEKATFNHYTDVLEIDILHFNEYNNTLPCSTPHTFKLNKVTLGGFYFDVEILDCSVTHNVQIETTLPGGETILSNIIEVSCSQTVSVDLTSYEGEFKFRIRQICENRNSDWSGYVSVGNISPTICNPLPSGITLEKTYSAYTIFDYFFYEYNFTDQVDVEIDYPGDITEVKENIVISNDGHKVTVRFELYRYYAAWGLYRFRFRRKCKIGTASSWGQFINYQRQYTGG